MRSPSRLDLLPLGLLALLAIAPPETRGTTAPGIGVVAAVFAVVSLAGSRSGVWRPVLALVVAAAAFPPAWILARAPGAVPESWAHWTVALALGLGVASLPRDRRLAPTLPAVVAAVGAVVGLHALWQRFHGLDRLADAIRAGGVVADPGEWLVRAEQGRAFAAFSTPAALGGWSVLVLPVVVAWAVTTRGRTRLVAWGAVALGVTGLAASVSATAAAALLGALAVATVTGIRGIGSRRTAAIAAGTVLVVLVGAAWLRADELWDADHAGNPWVLRARNVQVAAEMSADRPWVGVGLGGFADSYPGYRRPGDNETRFVHNLPLQATAELGVPLGLLAGATFAFAFAGAWWRREAGTPPWWYGIALGLLAFALHNLADFTAYLPSVAWTAAILCGWIARPIAVPRTPPPTSVRVGNALVALAAVAVAVAGHHAAAERRERVLLGVGSPGPALPTPWSADAHLDRARARLASITPGAGASATLAAALRDLDRAVAASPVRPSARRLRADVRRALGDRPGALSDALAASELHPASDELAEFARRMEAAAAAEAPP